MGAKPDKEDEEVTPATDNEDPKKRKSTIRRFNSINRYAFYKNYFTS